MADVVVIDASIAVKWLVYEPDSDKARKLGRQWRSESVRVAAPHVLLSELSNALHQRVRADRLTTARAARLLRRFVMDGLELHHSTQIYQRSIELASQLGQGAIYDSLYLSLAESLDCELWTADTRFYRAANQHSDNTRWLGEISSST